MSPEGSPKPFISHRSDARIPVVAMLLPMLLSFLSPIALAPVSEAQEAEEGLAPGDIWSEDYVFQNFPWGVTARLSSESTTTTSR